MLSGSLCGTIIHLDPIKLVGFVPETRVNWVKLGAMAQARLAAVGAVVSGRVTFLSRSADPETRTFSTEIEVPNCYLAICEGQTVATLIASDRAKVYLIPQSALPQNDAGTLGVRPIGTDNIVEFHKIEIVRDTTEGVWVTSLPQVANLIVVG